MRTFIEIIVTFISEMECSKGQAVACLYTSVLHLRRVEVMNEEEKRSRNILPRLHTFLERRTVSGKVDLLSACKIFFIVSLQFKTIFICTCRLNTTFFNDIIGDRFRSYKTILRPCTLLQT